jgi:hypothetical protein
MWEFVFGCLLVHVGPSDIPMFVIADVLSEEVILKWYKEGHSVKGKMLFLDQMKKFIEWLQNAEEGEGERLNMRSTVYI